MLILARINVWYFHSRVERTVDAGISRPALRSAARVAAIASLVLWAASSSPGRMIAYNWFDCDIQPQPAFINWAAGCVVPPAAAEPRHDASAVLRMVRGHAGWATAFAQSLWLFPVIEAVHLLASALLGGAILLVDLRLLGLGLQRSPDCRRSRAKPRRWLIGRVVVMLTTGTALFLSESIKCYYSQVVLGEDHDPAGRPALHVLVRQRVAMRAGDTATANDQDGRGVVDGAVVYGRGGGRWIGFS